MPALSLLVLSWLAAAVAWPRAARADGAFPMAQSVLLPSDRPHELILATSFGLVFSQDDGTTWTYTCEADQTLNGFRYVLGPPAAGGMSGDRLFTVSVPPPGAPVSLDDGCSWTLPGGALTDPSNPAQASDIFPDPSNVARVFLLAVPASSSDTVNSVYRSMDGGLTYVGPLFTPPDQYGGRTDIRPDISGIEVSASSPGVVYATWYERVGDHPHLARSTDGGDSWTDVPVEGQLGLVKPYLARVDPHDPQTIVLRVLSADNAANPFEGLALTHDGGQTWTTPLQIPGGTLDGFVLRQDGSLVAIGTMKSTDGNTPPSYLFRSTDGGKSFSMEALAYHAQGLAERAGTLYMATNNFQDLVALVSSDDGVTWKSRLRFDQISAIRSCAYATCNGSCSLLAGLTIFPAQVCGATDKPTPPAKTGGCNCVAAPAGGGLAGGVGLGLAVAVAFRRRRRR